MPAGRRQLKRRIRLSVLIALWALSVGVGMAALGQYASKPGPRPANPATWPKGTTLAAPANLPVLLLFAHPQCPCTRATLEELARIMAHCQGRLDARVLFTMPAGADAAWTESDLWETAGRIPGVTVLADRDGADARRFGARTSGHALLFDNSGKLLFSGGITSARGHEGDNAGRSAILGLVEGRASDLATTPIYGCDLFSEEPRAN